MEIPTTEELRRSFDPKKTLPQKALSLGGEGWVREPKTLTSFSRNAGRKQKLVA